MTSQQLPTEPFMLTIQLTLTPAHKWLLIDDGRLFRHRRVASAPVTASHEPADAGGCLTLTLTLASLPQESAPLTLQAKATTVHAVTLDEGHGDRPGAPSTAVRSRFAINEVEQKSAMDPEQICDDVEHALCHLHNTAQLAQNPLLQLINLEPWAPTAPDQLYSPGRALKQLLNEVITAISGVDAGQKLTPSQWRLDHYLHLRYRVGIQHKDLAARLGYTERHLSRLRREHLLEAAELILAQAG